MKKRILSILLAMGIFVPSLPISVAAEVVDIAPNVESSASEAGEQVQEDSHIDMQSTEDGGSTQTSDVSESGQPVQENLQDATGSTQDNVLIQTNAAPKSGQPESKNLQDVVKDNSEKNRINRNRIPGFSCW